MLLVEAGRWSLRVDLITLLLVADIAVFLWSLIYDIALIRAYRVLVAVILLFSFRRRVFSAGSVCLREAFR